MVGNPASSSGSSFQHLSHIHSAAIVENNTLIASLNSNSNSAFSPVRNTKDQINFQQPALPVPLEEVPLQLPKILSSESSSHELKNYIDCEILPDDENESQNQFDSHFNISKGEDTIEKRNSPFHISTSSVGNDDAISSSSDSIEFTMKV